MGGHSISRAFLPLGVVCILLAGWVSTPSRTVRADVERLISGLRNHQRAVYCPLFSLRAIGAASVPEHDCLHPPGGSTDIFELIGAYDVEQAIGAASLISVAVDGTSATATLSHGIRLRLHRDGGRWVVFALSGVK